jgi:hypothetical protein
MTIMDRAEESPSWATTITRMTNAAASRATETMGGAVLVACSVACLAPFSPTGHSRVT